MPSGGRLRRRLTRRIINEFSLEVTRYRYDGTPVLNKYGETIDGSLTLDSDTVKIVVVKDKREVEETLIGGLPEDNNKEILQFYFKGDEDIKTGDKIVYPVSTPNEWIIFAIEPMVFDGVQVINMGKGHRDARK